MSRGSSLAPLMAVALAACAAKTVCTPTGAVIAAPAPVDWRDTVTDADHDKLRQLRPSFLAGIAQARAAGFAAQVAAEGRLFNPDYAQDGVRLAPGSYRCRTFSLGTKRADRPAFVAGPPGACTVEADGQIEQFGLSDGPQRLVGRLFPDEPARQVFLGTRVLADEATALHYGRDGDRDTVGALQRVGDARWRIAIPAPAWGSPIQVIEIVPAA